MAGCGQLDSVEYLELESGAGGHQPAPGSPASPGRFGQPEGTSRWQSACPMAHARHLPGVRLLDSCTVTV